MGRQRYRQTLRPWSAKLEAAPQIPTLPLDYVLQYAGSVVLEHLYSIAEYLETN